MTTLDVLPYDILCEILLWLDNESWQDVSFVSKSLRLAAIPLIFRKIRIEKWYYGAAPNTREMVEVILSNEAIAGSIRVLDIGLQGILNDPFQTRQYTLPASIARLLISLPLLTCLMLNLPAQYAEPLFGEFKANAKKLTGLRSLVVPAWTWASLAQFCPHLQGLLVESQPPWAPEGNVIWFAQQCPNITAFVCFEDISTATIRALGEHLPQLEELGLLGTVEEKDIVDYLKDFRVFRKLRALWLPPIYRLRMDSYSFTYGTLNPKPTERRLMSAIESSLIAKGGPNVNMVTLGCSSRVVIYRRTPGMPFKLDRKLDIDGPYRGEMLEPRHRRY
ncbi:hypothetical protein FRC19_000302 [Serendipita sp. 401]|nr:hypothetical protein FRC19_000302 [Serendipita sp. 401]KAG9057991.1 hypothetical protein FS842_002327 [Serendipita sp. 407]